MAQFGIGADSLEAGVGVGGGLTDRVGTEVGELAGLEIAPHRLDRIEVVAVGGQPFDDEPVSLRPQPGPHRVGAVTGQAVPDEGRLVTTEVLA